MFASATRVGQQTKIKTMKTNTGTKDTHLDFFLERMFSAYKTKRGAVEQQKALDEFVASLPEDILSPVWRIKGLVIDRVFLCQP
jgi:hypothetical protein